LIDFTISAARLLRQALFKKKALSLGRRDKLIVFFNSAAQQELSTCLQQRTIARLILSLFPRVFVAKISKDNA
jgi:hypothetical protein